MSFRKCRSNRFQLTTAIPSVSSPATAGLGLYFCRRAVEAHGGHIDVVEMDDYPTCFRIRLPAA